MTTNVKVGTWIAKGTAGHERHGQSVVYDETDGKDIAIVYDGDAHAELISAAPEMLEALLETMEDWQDLGRITPEAVDHIQAAIRKARGE